MDLGYYMRDKLGLGCGSWYLGCWIGWKLWCVRVLPYLSGVVWLLEGVGFGMLSYVLDKFYLLVRRLRGFWGVCLYCCCGFCVSFLWVFVTVFLTCLIAPVWCC